MTSLQLAPQPLAASAVASPVLGFGMAFADLYRRDGLMRLDQAFLTFLRRGNPGCELASTTPALIPTAWTAKPNPLC